MNQEQARRLVDQTFRSDYLTDNFTRFIKQLLKNLDETGKFRLTMRGDGFQRRYAERFETYEKLGTFIDPHGVEIDVLAVELKRDTTLQRGRTSLRNFAADYLVKGQGLGKQAVLAAYFSDADDTWRFSYVKLDASLQPDASGKVREVYETTPAKRYSFLVGRNERTHTAQTQFWQLLTKESAPTIEEIEKAFSVETVTEAFFRDYKLVFDKVEAEVKRSIPDQTPNDKVAPEHRRLFTQRLFNRLMFIYFLQKKGWLAFEEDKNYLRRLFTEAEARRENFSSHRLYWLFFHGLSFAGEAAESKTKDWLIEKIGTVPYLNGGLFEIEDEFDVRGRVEVNNELFGEIIDLFELYNFTVDESTPVDVELAVDPEMLGKVFEELVTSRHESGSYYTPRQIVSFMCRESLKHYLAGYDDAAAVAEFVDEGRGENLREAETVLEALKRVRVCDPACGSGAYLLGMMQELLCLREALFASKHLGEASLYNRKRSIIKNNLYGVDKDRFAVQIAALRLWLSLAIDSSEPRPLPNLDYKIGCGDSLLAPLDIELQPDMHRAALVEQFRKLKDEHADVFDYERKKELHDEIENVRGKLAITLKHAEPPASQSERIKLAERDAADLRKRINQRVRESNKIAAVKLQSQLKNLERQLAEWRQQTEQAIRYDTHGVFDWTVEFAEVFAPDAQRSNPDLFSFGKQDAQKQTTSAGFDIVLANPPYVRMELFKPIKPILRQNFPEVHSDRADLYVYFYARAMQLLKDDGVGTFISSNKWLKAGYGKNLRQHLLNARKSHLVLDFGDLPVFKAKAYPCVFIWQQEERGNASTVWASVEDLTVCYENGIRNHIEKIAVDVPAEQFSVAKSGVTFNTCTDLQLGKGQSLKEYVEGQIYYGIKTGLNDAFIIDLITKDKLIDEDANSAEVIKSILGGNDVRRYGIHFRNSYLVYTTRGVDLRRYTAIEKHLRPFRQRLEARATRQEWYELQQPQSAYVPHFNSTKIIYPDIGKELRFAMDTEGFYSANTTYFIPREDWYLLGLLNSSVSFAHFRRVSSQIRGGYLRFFGQYLETFLIPGAPQVEREAIADLARRTQDLHTMRRRRIEQFLTEIKTPAAESSSRNPLEQVWTLTEDEFMRRTRSRFAPQIFRAAKDETSTLTVDINRLEREIDERVAELYGVKLEQN